MRDAANPVADRALLIACRKATPVHNGGPHLEAVVRVAVAKLLWVFHKRRETFRRTRVPPIFQYLLNRIDKELEGG